MLMAHDSPQLPLPGRHALRAAPAAASATVEIIPPQSEQHRRIAVLQEVRNEARKEQEELLSELREFAANYSRYAAYPAQHRPHLALLEPVGLELANRFKERQAALMRLDAKLEEVIMGA